MSSINSVIVLGATDTIGQEIIKALLDARNPEFTVTAARRPRSNALPPTAPSHFTPQPPPQGDRPWTTHPVSHSGTPSLTSTPPPKPSTPAPPSTMSASSDTFHSHAHELQIFVYKLHAQQALERLVQRQPPRPDGNRLALDGADHGPVVRLNHRPGHLLGEPHDAPVVGHATAAVLRDPVRFRDRPANFAEFTVSSKELLGILQGREQQQHKEGGEDDVKRARRVRSRWMVGWVWRGSSGIGNPRAACRISSIRGYQMLATYGLFEEGNQYVWT
ncbi:hypothetical protein BO82DRAFT_428688 [Aspergillus uvarum CBS 121591]|uniref:NAD(P)-binding domain-containing protein n=1 Tax=Aspergillus uvarum CBS 121591 TaxID=1448315 RepID=A0A319CKZ9_9EURO|nr:hypothetical protein BO82DRAFT_428688 [Aspergillus uvarum CBS 121591]PYH86235.1 hypothetical protein BO82DRAFT_428688 [Aspergillus uvarum CBS 121591]